MKKIMLFGIGWLIVAMADIVQADPLLFYRAETGDIATGRLGTDGNFTGLATGGGLSTGWTHVVATGRELLFYRTDTGDIATGRLGTDGNFTGLATGGELSSETTEVSAVGAAMVVVRKDTCE